MNDKEKRIRARAQQIKMKNDGSEVKRDDHWRRAEAQHEITEMEFEAATKANREANDELASSGSSTVLSFDSKPVEPKSAK